MTGSTSTRRNSTGSGRRQGRARALQRKQSSPRQRQQQRRRRKLPQLPHQQQQQQQPAQENRLAETQQQPILLLQAHVRRLVHQLQRLVEALPAVPGIGWPSPLMLLFPPSPLLLLLLLLLLLPLPLLLLLLLLLLRFPQLCGYDDSRYRTLANDFVESIMGREPEPIEGSDGMSLLRNVVDLESGRPLDVVIRKVTRPFWQACIDAADTPRERIRVCAVGTSGIGKTACTSLLIKMLLERQTKVVYHVRTLRKCGWIYEFIPGYRGGGASSVVTNVYPERTAWSSIPTMDDPSAYYVVDPGNSTDSCNPPCLFRPKVIIVASPDARHWGDRQFVKRRVNSYGTRTYFPLWELDELLQARSHLGPWLTEAQVKDRYAQLGGIPSHVFLPTKATCSSFWIVKGRPCASWRHRRPRTSSSASWPGSRNRWPCSTKPGPRACWPGTGCPTPTTTGPFPSTPSTS
jgi:hypothetical protein